MEATPMEQEMNSSFCSSDPDASGRSTDARSVALSQPLMTERMIQIRRAHQSARPKPENPAWMNCHNDMAYMFKQIDAALAAAA